MKMLKIGMLLGALTLISCASSEKKESKESERSFTKDYVLMDASQKTLPDWIAKPSKGDKSKERKKNRYFVNESAHTNKRLCLRSAESRATARIAQEIAQFMKNSYAEATQGGADEDVSEYMQEQLATESQAFIIGASVLKTYWELRGYKEALGAEEDMKKYNCFALVKMSKKSLEKAIKKSRAKLLGEIEDPEVKKKTDKALDHVASKFNDLDAPVKVENSEE
jgi:hypothetical protein